MLIFPIFVVYILHFLEDKKKTKKRKTGYKCCPHTSITRLSTTYTGTTQQRNKPLSLLRILIFSYIWFHWDIFIPYTLYSVYISIDNNFFSTTFSVLSELNKFCFIRFILVSSVVYPHNLRHIGALIYI